MKLTSKNVYARVVVKLSGEALAGEQGYGFDSDVLDSVAAEISELSGAGIQTAVVVGGGNIWRGAVGSARGMDRATADYMGMLATCINALALKDALEHTGVVARVMSAIEMRQVAETYIRERAIRHLEKDRVVILAAGNGTPYFSTDTTAALRAAEIRADVILMAKTVDGVYNSDPKMNPSALRYEEITFAAALDQRLGVMDATALSLCRDNDIPVIVFSMAEGGSILKAAAGERIGTLVRG